MSGPLHSFRVLEIAGIGPAPMACMLLADLGAEVLRVERVPPGVAERLGFGPDKCLERKWPQLRARLTEIFRGKTRADWCDLLEGTDACFAPVLSLEEGPKRPHNEARATFTAVDGVTQSAAAPRFDRTPAAAPSGVPDPGSDTDEALQDWGFTSEEVQSLRTAGSIR